MGGGSDEPHELGRAWKLHRCYHPAPKNPNRRAGIITHPASFCNFLESNDFCMLFGVTEGFVKPVRAQGSCHCVPEQSLGVKSFFVLGFWFCDDIGAVGCKCTTSTWGCGRVLLNNGATPMTTLKLDHVRAMWPPFIFPCWLEPRSFNPFM